MSQYTISYKSNNNVVYSCKYHVVWCPKYCRSVLVSGVDVRLKEIIQDVCTECRAELIELEVMPEHVHLLGKSIHNTVSIAWSVLSKVGLRGCCAKNTLAQVAVAYL